MIKQLSIVGVGLIGGSLALALKQAGYCRKVVGIGRNGHRLQAAQKAGVIDQGTTDYAAGLAGADMIFVAVPLNAYVETFENIKGRFKADAIITDAGSAKACVIEDALKVFGELPTNFVPGHPIAGTEKSGFEAAFPELYRKRRVVLTPVVRQGLASTSDAAIKAVAAMWEAAGAVVEITTAEHHDSVLAATSHLPHILAFGLVDSLARENNVEEIFRFAAGGFRDFTRIAASDPAVWRDICLRNREALLNALRSYRADLDDLETAIANGDADKLMEIFTRAKTARDKFSFN